MQIRLREQGDITVVNIEGKLDTNTATTAESEIDAVLNGGATQVIVNFEKLDYISSVGLRLLLATAKRLKKSGGTLRVCGLNATVQEVFDISGFTSILSVVATEAEALQGN